MKINFGVIVLVMCYLFIGNQAAFSQDESGGGKFSYGAKIGAIVSQFSNAQPHTFQKTGLTVGAVVEYDINDLITVQAEPAYIQQGGSYLRFSDDSRFSSDGGILSDLYTMNSKITLHTADLTVLAKYEPFTFGDVTTNIVLGPSFSYVINAVENFERTYYYNQTFTTVRGNNTVNSEYKNMLWAATAGVGGEVSLGSYMLLIDLRYRLGLNAVKEGFSYIDLNDVQGDLKMNSYSFTLGVKF